MLNYEKNPQRIYQQSFATVQQEACLEGFQESLIPVVVRMIHACGMPDITTDIRTSANFVETVIESLSKGSSILCDSNMTGAGIIRRYLPQGCEVISPNFNETLALSASEAKTTQSAMAVDLWKPILGGSIVVIGNAPTALFRILELLDERLLAPSAIIGCPVGFVGAAESKNALANHAGDIEYLTLLGRRGGSAIAAAAVNAILIQIHNKNDDSKELS